MSWFNLNRPRLGKGAGKQKASGKGDGPYFRPREPRVLPGTAQPPIEAQPESREPQAPPSRPATSDDEPSFR